MSELDALIKDHEDGGCEHIPSLGIHRMPTGYALMLDSDQMYYYWVNDHGESGAPHWNRWAVYRGAKARSAAFPHRNSAALTSPEPSKQERAGE